ncbi:MAG: hypothetical protein O7A62_13810, partial [Alphaproteobacteria bacterium]|nr:hypothetical protein [Alphaproteobacteria bacterium]
ASFTQSLIVSVTRPFSISSEPVFRPSIKGTREIEKSFTAHRKILRQQVDEASTTMCDEIFRRGGSIGKNSI